MQYYRNPISRLLASNYWKKKVLAPEICNSGEISRGLQMIRSRWPTPASTVVDDESPIFVLAASWGSGSTLLQRLIVSGGNTLIWGEPLDHAIPIHRLAQILSPFSDRWPKNKYFALPDDSQELRNTWIANLTPDPESLRQAHRLFILKWLKDSALSNGYSNWGLKEVRLTIDHARYLRWLFPQGKFVVIVRDVVQSYLSCKDVRWLSVWPEYRVNRLSSFAHHWVHTASGFRDGIQEIGGLMLRFEDLVEGNVDLQSMADYLGIETIVPDTIDRKIGARGRHENPLSARDRFVINSIAHSLRSDLGYT